MFILSCSGSSADTRSLILSGTGWPSYSRCFNSALSNSSGVVHPVNIIGSALLTGFPLCLNRPGAY